MKENADVLRNRAEQILGAISTSDEEMKGETLHHLFHELQVYQIELEMQNEELRNSQIVLEDNRRRYYSLFENAPAGYVVLDQYGMIRQYNKMFASLIQEDGKGFERKSFADLLHFEDSTVFRSRFNALFKNPEGKKLDVRICSRFKEHHVLITAALHDGLSGDAEKENQELLLTIMDITPQKKTEAENKKLIDRLNEALSQVKQLTGLLPICSHCKKIRDDKGYWQEVETYIHNHSEARFSHSICRECAKKHYPDFEIYDSFPGNQDGGSH